MKLLEFKNFIVDRIILLRIIILEQFFVDLAYVFDNVSSFLLSSGFSITMVIFINVIYGNVKLVAGYTYDEMMFFNFIGQINFFILTAFTSANVEQLIVMVNKGDLDLILTKPLPALFYVTFRKLQFAFFIRNLFPSLLVVGLATNWSNLSFSFINILAGTILIFAGQICIHVFMFLLALISFKTGGGGELLSISWGFEYFAGRMIPYEGFELKRQLFFVSLLPVLISTGLASSVMLGKTDAWVGLAIALPLAIIMLIAKSFAWKWALKHYSSASS